MSRYLATALLCAFIFPFSVLAQEPLKLKTSSRTQVMDTDGDVLCELPASASVLAVARDASTDQISIQTQDPSCATGGGFVDQKRLQLERPNFETTRWARVGEQAANLRTSPTTEGNAACRLSPDTEVQLLLNVVSNQQARWRKVRLERPPRGCPSEGWVAQGLLNPSVNFSKLPLVNTENPEARPQTPPESSDGIDRSTSSQNQTEGNICTDCETKQSGPDPLRDTQNIAAQIQDSARDNLPDSVFLEYVKKLNASKNKACPKEPEALRKKCNRGLVQMPMARDERGREARNAGFCGTHHYSPDQPTGVDAYASPLAACSLLALAQEWRKTQCPSSDMGCTIQWGDISHRNLTHFNGHQSHTQGECIDIRPMRNTEFEDSGLRYRDRRHDRETTIKFLQMAKKYGADPIIFNDPVVRRRVGETIHSPGHEGHIHLCFPKSEQTEKACANLKIDPNLCPEVP